MQTANPDFRAASSEISGLCPPHRTLAGKDPEICVTMPRHGHVFVSSTLNNRNQPSRLSPPSRRFGFRDGCDGGDGFSLLFNLAKTLIYPVATIVTLPTGATLERLNVRDRVHTTRDASYV